MTTQRIASPTRIGRSAIVNRLASYGCLGSSKTTAAQPAEKSIHARQITHKFYHQRNQMRTLLAFLMLSLPCLAQADHYTASASTTALTIQQPASNARQITFGTSSMAGASVYCVAAATATFKWNGAAATATAGSEIKLPGTLQPSGATVWTASNVGSGTTGPVYNVPAGGTMAFDLSWFRMGTQGTATNLTIATSGTCTITFSYSAEK